MQLSIIETQPMALTQMTYTVQNTSTYAADYRSRIPAFKVVAYRGAGVNFPVESKLTADRDEAQRWADAANAGGDVPEAGFASYSDD